MYDRATEFWEMLFVVFQALGKHGALKRSAMGQFWGAHMRFFKGFLMAAKVRCTLLV